MLKRIGVLLLVLTSLLACDTKRIEELEEGVATEADVRARFGEPAAVYPKKAARARSSTRASPKASATT